MFYKCLLLLWEGGIYWNTSITAPISDMACNDTVPLMTFSGRFGWCKDDDDDTDESLFPKNTISSGRMVRINWKG